MKSTNKKLRYKVSIKPPEEGEEPETYIRKFAVTANPVMQAKGMAFSSSSKAEMSFSDELKMRIIAPAIIPGVYDYKDRKTGKEFEVEFSKEDVLVMYSDLMANPERLKGMFNDDHKNGSYVNSYLLESWIVEDSEKDKSSMLYNMSLPVGTIVFVQQYKDLDSYNQAVKNGATGLSLEGKLVQELMMSMELQGYADAIIINKEGSVLMLKRAQGDGFESGKWCLPGGKIEADESAQEACCREMNEETGLVHSNVEPLDAIENEDGTTSNYFTVDISDYEGGLQLSEEHVDYKYMSLEELGKAEVIKGENERFKTLVEKAKSKKMDKKIYTLSMVDQVNNWEREVENESFKLGDTITYKDQDGNSIAVGAGEYVSKDDQHMVTDSKGVIVFMKEKESVVETKASKMKEGEETTITKDDGTEVVYVVKDGALVVKEAEKEVKASDTGTEEKEDDAKKEETEMADPPGGGTEGAKHAESEEENVKIKDVETLIDSKLAEFETKIKTVVQDTIQEGIKEVVRATPPAKAEEQQYSNTEEAVNKEVVLIPTYGKKG